MSGQHIGYVRVSSIEQNIDRQLSGVELHKSFIDKMTGSTKDRPALAECLNYIREGDTLHVHSIDRLARNLNDLLTIIEELTQKKIKIHFHKENMLFTGEENPMQNLMLQMMGAVAEFERALIRERQAEGIAKAKQKGKRLGRPQCLNQEEKELLFRQADTGIPVRVLATNFNVSRQTVYRLTKEQRKAKLDALEKERENP